MTIRSLSYRTGLMFARFDGVVLDRGDYVVVRSPKNPGFFWGNYLVFPRPPSGDDLTRWPAIFAHEFAAEGAKIRHEAFGWECPDGDDRDASAKFEARGYAVEDNVGLCLDHPPSVTPAAPADIRSLDAATEWEKMRALNIVCDPLDGGDDAYGVFKERLRDRYRAMVQGDHGFWLGAFAGDQLVAQLGLFFAEGLGRFQYVETHPDWRCRGICTALVAEGCRRGLADSRAGKLVIVAQNGGAAERIYRRLGFAPVERVFGACRPT